MNVSDTSNSTLTADQPPEMDYSTTVFLRLVGCVTKGTTAVFLLQLFLVTYMYFRVSPGTPYWNTLLAMSIAGLLGITMENLQGILAEVQDPPQWIFSLSIAAEPCWIVSEFGVIALTMFKFKALLKRSTFMVISIVEGIIFAAFVFCRFRIGVRRYLSKKIESHEIWSDHVPAFSIIALGGLICSVGIIHVIRRQAVVNQSSTFARTLFNSSLFLLLIVDLVTVVLAIMSALQPSSSTGAPHEELPNHPQTWRELFQPLLILKSAFALILAVDSLVVKQAVHQTSLGSSLPSAGGMVRRKPTVAVGDVGGLRINVNDPSPRTPLSPIGSANTPLMVDASRRPSLPPSSPYHDNPPYSTVVQLQHPPTGTRERNIIHPSNPTTYTNNEDTFNTFNTRESDPSSCNPRTSSSTAASGSSTMTATADITPLHPSSSNTSYNHTSNASTYLQAPYINRHNNYHHYQQQQRHYTRNHN
ncbi:hypothetical protein HK102_009288 [Quaeritorhiza haematococci]|nr:hypothetical protein HK102_009288 [Quaeritorhiza haematococci]